MQLERGIIIVYGTLFDLKNELFPFSLFSIHSLLSTFIDPNSLSKDYTVKECPSQGQRADMSRVISSVRQEY